MLYLTFYRSDNLIHITYHRLCQYITCHVSHIIITYYIIHITPHMSRITYYIYSKVLITYHTLRITQYTLPIHILQISEWHMSYQKCHMSHVIPYILPIRQPNTYNISRLCQDITCHISHIIITYYIVHITHHMSRITYYIHSKVLITYHTLRITRYILPIHML